MMGLIRCTPSLRLYACLASFCFLGTTISAFADLPPCPATGLLPADSQAYDLFGSGVDLDEDWAVIGAQGSDAKGPVRPGSAYFFRREGNEWVEFQEVFAPVSTFSNQFGFEVAIEGDWAAIGDPGNICSPSVVHIYRWNGTEWSFSQTLTAPGGKGGKRFGDSIAMDAGALVVGAPGNLDCFTGPGVFVFRLNGTNWTFEQELIPADPALDLGIDVDIHGDRVIAGNPGRTAANVFKRTGGVWIEEQVLTDPAALSFGESVALHGSKVAVGVPDDENGDDCDGSVRAYHWDGFTWVFDERLLPLVHSQFCSYGKSLALDSNLLIVNSASRVHINYFAQSWVETRTIITNASPVNLDAGRLIIGKPFISQQHFWSGSAVMYELDQCAIIPAVSSITACIFGAVLLLGGALVIRRRQKLLPPLTILIILNPVLADLRPRAPEIKQSEIKRPQGESVLIVKFRDDLRVRINNENSLISASQQDVSLINALAQTHGVHFKPLLNLPPETLTRLETAAALRSGNAQPDLGGMFEVIGADSALYEVAQALNKLNEVEWIQFAPVPSLQQTCPSCSTSSACTDCSPCSPDYFSQRTTNSDIRNYFASDPGIDVDHAWGLTPSIKGAGIKLAVVEETYLYHVSGSAKAHEDLCGVTNGNDMSCYNSADARHGSGTLGMLFAENNATDYGWTGMVHEATPYFYSSRTLNASNECDSLRITEALTAACDELEAGDVVSMSLGLRAEDASGVGPVEFGDLAVYTATTVCRDKGVTVVAAAGNGNQDLDDELVSTYVYHNFRPDSGAIIVGAGTADTSHERCINSCGPGTFTFSSTHGKRVNLQGWGDYVFSLGAALSQYGSGSSVSSYTNRYNGTSAATPMVAGAVTLIQSYVKDKYECTLGPLNVRDLMSDKGICQNAPSRSSCQCPSVSDKIGEFPDLQTAIEWLAGEYGDTDYNTNGTKDACEYMDCDNDCLLDLREIKDAAAGSPSVDLDCDDDGLLNSCERDRDCDGTPDDCDSSIVYGACCDYFNNLCIVSTQCECTAAGGIFDSANPTCLSPIGICCNGSTCSESTSTTKCECLMNGGQFFLDEECGVTRACCSPSGVCSVRTHCSCLSIGGTWKTGSSCIPATCGTE